MDEQERENYYCHRSDNDFGGVTCSSMVYRNDAKTLDSIIISRWIPTYTFYT
jgi:hypothetical protein